MILEFYKYQGTGNDFIIIDNRNLQFPSSDYAFIARLCNRKYGIGADGLILLQPQSDGDYYMKYFNSDGKESSMCGNGGRCIAAFAHKLNISGEKARFLAIDGWHESEITYNNVRLKMQDVKHIDVRDNKNFILNTGSPHYVSFIDEPVKGIDLIELAKRIRYSNEFKTDGINVNFSNCAEPGKIEMRTYERGVEDETLSCGTGVTAAAVSSALLKNSPAGQQRVEVLTPGGKLAVTFDFKKDTLSFSNIWLEGAADFVFKGHIQY